MTADNLIGQIVDPITGNLDILAAAAGGISNAIMSYLKLGDTFGAEKDYFDTYIGIAGLQSEVDYPEINDESLLQVYTNAKAVQQLVNQEAVVQAVFEASTKSSMTTANKLNKRLKPFRKRQKRFCLTPTTSLSRRRFPIWSIWELNLSAKSMRSKSAMSGLTGVFPPWLLPTSFTAPKISKMRRPVWSNATKSGTPCFAPPARNWRWKMYKIELRTSAVSMFNFTDFHIQKSVYQLANTGTFIALKKDVNDLKRLKQSLKIGMPGQIRIDDEIALTGFVSECRPGYYQKEPCLTVKVNSEASRLVGASAGRGRYYIRQSFVSIAQDLIKDFNIVLNNRSSNRELVPEFVVSAGDDIDVVLNNLALLTNTFIYSDNDGSLVIADRIQKRLTNSVLMTGENISDIKFYQNAYSDFEQVVLHRQQALNDDLTLAEIINSSRSENSRGTKRQKHKTVDLVTTSLLSAVREGLEDASFDFQVIGSSLKTTEGRLYDVNTPIIVRDDWLELNDTYLITDLYLRGGEAGYQAKLNLEEL